MTAVFQLSSSGHLRVPHLSLRASLRQLKWEVLTVLAAAFWVLAASLPLPCGSLCSRLSSRA